MLLLIKPLLLLHSLRAAYLIAARCTLRGDSLLLPCLALALAVVLLLLLVT